MEVIENGHYERAGSDDWDSRSGRYEDYGDGPYIFFSNMDAHGDIPNEFWDHVEIVLGRKIRPQERAVGFSCSC